MIPSINPHQMQQVMRKLGVKQEEIEALEVIITCKDKRIRIIDPHVSKIIMMGDESLQITGKFIEESLERFSKDDITTVIEQTNCSEAEAVAALEETDDLAGAILKLKKE